MEKPKWTLPQPSTGELNSALRCQLRCFGGVQLILFRWETGLRGNPFANSQNGSRTGYVLPLVFSVSAFPLWDKVGSPIAWPTSLIDLSSQRGWAVFLPFSVSSLTSPSQPPPPEKYDQACVTKMGEKNGIVLYCLVKWILGLLLAADFKNLIWAVRS